MTMPIRLTGQIEHITFTNAENGFTIAKVRVSGRRDLVTVVGNLLAPTPGEVLDMQGEWASHPRFGEQFKVVQFTTQVPATVYGITKYLGSGLIKGLGPVMAGRIVERFGMTTLDIIENDIDRLAEVPGVGVKRIAMIARAWEAQRDIRDVMMFLQSHGVGPGYAAKIFRQYGSRAVAVVRENPYRLATEVAGIGFITADRIAENIGIPRHSPLRVEAGVLFVLQQLVEEGHVYYPRDPLIERCRDILGVEKALVEQALNALAAEVRVIVEKHRDAAAEAGGDAVFLPLLHRCETTVAQRLRMLLEVPRRLGSVDAVGAVAWVQDRLGMTFSENQVEALRGALAHKLMVITGGPGTGKTTIVNAILKIFSRRSARVLLAAPTGRAAKRLSEATGHEAKTLHRLLEYSTQRGGFQRNEEKPLDGDLLVVDESSMIDTVLMHHLLKAVPLAAACILVGDVNQLPSVGPGNILGDIINSGVVPVVRLTEIFRQARQSQIVVNAHRINQGLLPVAEPGAANDAEADFYFIEQEEPERVLDTIVELARNRIPRRFGLDPVDDIQVLTPMHKGIVGATHLNRSLQEALNPGEGGVARGDRVYRVNDKVMQIRNNYDKDVFNGDIGRITAISTEERELTVLVDGREVVYDFSDLDEIIHAYAVSVHKSQGSEYPAVIFPVLTQHYILLQRNLIYTAVTRARRLVVIVGTRKALAIGVKNMGTDRRYTRLCERLNQATIS